MPFGHVGGTPSATDENDAPLITAKGVEALRAYSYKGEDHSIWYNAVGSRLAEFLVDKFTPRWVAPNVITIIGLFMPIGALCIAFAFNPAMDGKGVVPAWVPAFGAFATFAYATLDNMDGKQARRTGSSSALGLLFDHGCDAINAALISSAFIALVTGVSAGTWQAHCWWVIPIVPFFLNTWEEYHIGKMVLPVLNGPNEGLLIMCGLLLLTSFYGTAFWTVDLLKGTTAPALRALAWFAAPAVDALRMLASVPEERVIQPSPATVLGYGSSWLAGLPYGPPSGGVLLSGVVGSARSVTSLELVLALTLSGVALTITVQTVNTLRYLRAQGASLSDLVAALMRQLPLWLLLAATSMWFSVPETLKMIKAHWAVFYAIPGCFFVEIVVLLMVSHVCNQGYGNALRSLPERLMIFTATPPLVRIGVPALLGQSAPAPFIAVGLLLSLAASAIPAAWTIYGALAQTAEVLDVDIFSIAKQVARNSSGGSRADKPAKGGKKAAAAAAAAAAVAAAAEGGGEEEEEEEETKASVRRRATSAGKRGSDSAAAAPAPAARGRRGSAAAASVAPPTPRRAGSGSSRPRRG